MCTTSSIFIHRKSIVNIITKKDNRFGINGSASIGFGTRDKYNASIALNLRNDKWNLFFNSNWRNNKNYQSTRIERLVSDGTLASASYEDNMRTHGGWFNTLGAEYTIPQAKNWTVKAQYSQNTTSIKPAGVEDFEAKQIIGGVDYAFNKQVKTYGYAGYLTLEQASKKDKQPVAGLGLEFKF